MLLMSRRYPIAEDLIIRIFGQRTQVPGTIQWAQRPDPRLRRRLREEPAGRVGAGVTSEAPVESATCPSPRLAARTAEGEGHGRASPASQAGGWPFGQRSTYMSPIITIQNEGTSWSVAEIGAKMSTAVNPPRMLIQRGSSPTR